MADVKSLKSQNRWSLWILFLFNIMLLLLLLVANSFIDAKLSVDMLTSAKSLGIIVGPILVFVLNGQLPPDVKARLVFWRWKDPLPGCRAFTKHGKSDARVNMGALTQRHGQLPSSPREQNQLWYKLYKEFQEDISVKSSHQSFLLSRDMAAMEFLFLILTGVPAIFISVWPWNTAYFFLLVFTYFIMANLARNHGIRFVTNVLALESIK